MSNPQIRLSTSLGDIDVELYAQEAPQTVANFLSYVDEGFFGGTVFHRVIPGFMVQGGGLTADLQRKRTHAEIENEAANGLKNEVGTLAMARTSEPHSASSQFFINVKDNDFLNYQGPGNFGYCVFGRVVNGMDVVKQIERTKTTTRGSYQDVPVEPIVIASAARL